MASVDIVIGILTAAFLIFLRNASVVAQRQKITSTRLDSYLRYWKRVAIDNDWFNIYYIGVQWNKEAKEIIQQGGSSEDLVNLEKEKKKLILELTEKLENDPADLGDTFTTVQRQISILPDKLIYELFTSLQKSSQNLVDGKTFVSDEDASYLDPYIAATCIDLKMKLVNIISKVAFLTGILSANKVGFKIEENAKEISDLIWQIVLVSKDIDTLSKAIQRYTKKSTISLTLENVGL